MSRPPMWKLVIEDDEGKRTDVPLTRAEYPIGRREGNVIRLTERNVSRDHARLYRKASPGGAGVFVIEDLTSYNGVFVNGLRITHALSLAHGDLVQIGDYRIVLQDEALNAASEADGDSKQTVPSAPHSRAATLLDRPNRLVMLAGPTPGAEYPLDRDRMTIGRAEDASISVNHNSVSRLHCEVHALGDGRFEIVDKGSSNGVRVNAAELRRGIVEPGDVIELGDVRFKFVGAGQIFMPTESQQLSSIGDRNARELARERRASNAMPVAVFAVVVCAGAAGAWAYTRPRLGVPSARVAAARTPEELVIAEAQRLCESGDFEAAHAALKDAIAPSSHWREAPGYRDVESQWAEATLAKADSVPDLGQKRGLYQSVAQTTTVDAPHRKAAADRLQQLDATQGASAATPLELPAAATAATKLGAVEDAAPTGRADHKPPSSVDSMPLAVNPTAQASSPSTSPLPAAAPSSVDEHERQLALAGTQDSKIQLKQQLEPRVYGGRATDAEVRLLISTCRDLGDKSCVQQARAVLKVGETPLR